MWMTDGYAEIDFINLNGRIFKRQSSQGMGNGAVRTLYEDNQERIWISNSTDTFYIVDPKAGTVKHIIDISKGLKMIPSRLFRNGKGSDLDEFIQWGSLYI